MWLHASSFQFLAPISSYREKDKITLLLQKDLERHINNECPYRDHKREHCGKKSTYAKIAWIHDYIYEKKVIPCTNTECPESMECGKIKSHLDYCEYTIVSCKYKKFGFDMKFERKAMKIHEKDDSIHLHQALGAVVKLQDDLQSAKETIEKITLKTEKSLTFKLTNFEQRNKDDCVFISPSFYTSPEGYHMCIEVHVNYGGLKEVGIFVKVRV